MKKRTKTMFFITLFLLNYNYGQAAGIGIFGVQSNGPEKIIEREAQNNTTIPIIGTIFDEYGENESNFLTKIVSKLGKDRVYHISISPFGFTAKEVAEGIYDKSYDKFFEDIKKLQIKVIFRTMHEMNGGWYSRSSQPEDFKKARIYVRKLARHKHNIQSDQLLFSLSFNSQDLPTTDKKPTQDSFIEYCGEWRIKTKGRCPRKVDYYPGNRYVDLVGVTLYNRGRSRTDNRAKRKSPRELFNEDNLLQTLQQRKKPIIIDELGTTAINFNGEWSQNKAKEVFENNDNYKDEWLKEMIEVVRENPIIKAIMYFNIDATAGASKQVIGQAERSIILSPYHKDYKEGVRFLTVLNRPKNLKTLFVQKIKKGNTKK